VKVSIYGAGQAGGGVAALLARRPGVEVLGPFGRDDRERALTGGADVVVIATTSFLREIAPDVRDAIEAGANVITSAEEAAYPWATSPKLADELDALARARGVTVLGAGLNPGFAFDALVLTATGATAEIASLRVERVVDLSGFGPAVLRRIGVGHAPNAFAAGVSSGEITGHIGFPQSMWLVAASVGVQIEQIDREITPILAEREHVAQHVTVPAGATAGFEQRYVGVVDGRPWFTALFLGHVDPVSIGEPTRDEIHVDGRTPIDLAIVPGLNAQTGSAAVLANSVRRVLDAPPGWLTVADLPPATPAWGTSR
jgi:4-hydroxy-tetrahydrodipicolinate reductase